VDWSWWLDLNHNNFNSLIQSIVTSKTHETGETKQAKRLTAKQAANIARGSWKKLSGRLGIEDVGQLPAPSRKVAYQLAKKYMSSDGTLSLDNFQKFRRALTNQIVQQTVYKRAVPSFSQYVLSAILGTVAVAKARTMVNITNKNLETALNFALPSIVVGPALGTALMFKARGGSFSKLTRDVNIAKKAVDETKKTIRFTHDAIEEVARVRSLVNRTQLTNVVGNVWAMISPPPPQKPKKKYYFF